MTNIRYPNISGDTATQLSQIRSYLWQLADALNRSDPFTAGENRGKASAAGSSPEISSSELSALKALIIKSADVVEAYTDRIEKKLTGKYVAQSEFGSYSHALQQQITAEAGKLEQKFQSVQTLVADLQTRLLETEGYIRTGILYYAGQTDALPEGAPVYGMEVGQTARDGSFRRFSRFTATGVEFYDSNDAVFASITEGKMQIRGIVVQDRFTLGGFSDEVLADGTLVTRWIGI